MPCGPDMCSARRVAEALRSGHEVSDAAFDALLPDRPRAWSKTFWTPVAVAMVASEWLRQSGVKRLLDVGSGAGKLCSIASLLLGQRVFGVEQRPHLAGAARELARSLGADVEILDGTFDQISAGEFDAFYFYSPFDEQVSDPAYQYDRRVAFSDDRYFDDLETVEAWLNAARVGTTLVTYHGMGGRIPTSFCVEKEQNVGTGRLRLWVKRALHAREFFVEVGDALQTGSELRALLARLELSEEESPILHRLAHGGARTGAGVR